MTGRSGAFAVLEPCCLAAAKHGFAEIKAQAWLAQSKEGSFDKLGITELPRPYPRAKVAR